MNELKSKLTDNQMTDDDEQQQQMIEKSENE